MLPPGHIAGGYITAKLVIRSLNYNFTPHQIRELALLGTLFAFMPDLDFFYAFFKIKRAVIDNSKANHRKYFTHAPLTWLVIGLAVFFTSQSEFIKTLGLLLWLCPWSHFILDSEWGVMWFWPFSKRFYPFSEAYYHAKYAAYQNITINGFWKYWYAFAKREYSKRSGYIEIILIIIALVLAIK